MDTDIKEIPMFDKVALNMFQHADKKAIKISDAGSITEGLKVFTCAKRISCEN